MSFTSFIEKWVCCAAYDDEETVLDVRTVIGNPDQLAEEYLEFTHRSRERHVPVNVPEVVIYGNVRAPDVPLCLEENQPSMGLVELRGEVASTAVRSGTPEVLFEGGFTVERNPTLRAILDDDLGSSEGAIRLPDRLQVPDDTAVVLFLAPTPISDIDPRPTQVAAQCGVEDEEGPTQVYVLEQDVVEVKEHRRIARRHRGDYVAAVVSQIKNRLGLPVDNEANRLAVRRMANNIMIKHGVRPTHVRAVVEKVIAGVFVPDEYDIASAKLTQSKLVSERRERHRDARPKNAWLRLGSHLWGNPRADPRPALV